MRNSERRLLDITKKCDKCRSLSTKTRAYTGGKKAPYFPEYRVKSRKRRVVFLAESPPLSGRFFYEDRGTKDGETTRSSLLDVMQSADLLKDGTLTEFKEEFYFTDAVKCPFGGKGKNRKPPKGAISNCQEILAEEIKLTGTSVICAMGTTAVKALLEGKASIENQRVVISPGNTRIKPYLRESSASIVIVYHPKAPVSWSRKKRRFQMLSKMLGK